MYFAAWNKSTYVDLIVLITKVLVAAALIGHAHFIQSHLRPEPVYGVLDNADYAHSVQETEGILVKVSWIAGGYVLISSAIGLLGRFLHAAPLYGLYYCANVFGFGVCLAAAIIPTMWGTSKVGYCLAAEESCMAVDDLAACPYPVTFTSDGRGRFLAEGDAAAGVGGGSLTSSSPCCYLPEFVRFCGNFLGAVYTQTIIAVVLLALVMTQSMVSCFYLCCDCDRPWTTKGRVPDMPDLPEFTVPMALPRRYRGITAKTKEAAAAAAAAAEKEKEEEEKKEKEEEKKKRKNRSGGGGGAGEEEGKEGAERAEGASVAAVEEGTAGVAAGAVVPPAIPPAAETGSAQVTPAAAAAAAAAGLASAAIEEKEVNGGE